ncbi:MAG: FMN-binding negative transcriptional regulator [Phycisphaerales bacterium]|nr:FMN-binding negative transcriptional regulator [Phycisphaerales bacterium]
MTYPPPARRVTDPAAALELMAAHPFAHLFTSHNGLRATRIPLVTDSADGRAVALRGHLNRQNPQAQALDGAPVLVAFSGHATYVSPHWRADKGRGGTYDYEEVIVRGTARRVEGLESFRRMIDDLSSLIEPQYAEVGDYPVWQTSMAVPGYIERLVDHVTQFVIDIEELETISKLHQHFPEEDRRSVADHLSRCRRDASRALAEKIRRLP